MSELVRLNYDADELNIQYDIDVAAGKNKAELLELYGKAYWRNGKVKLPNGTTMSPEFIDEEKRLYMRIVHEDARYTTEAYVVKRPQDSVDSSVALPSEGEITLHSLENYSTRRSYRVDNLLQQTKTSYRSAIVFLERI